MTDAPPSALDQGEHDVGGVFKNWWTGLHDAVSPPPSATPAAPATPASSAQQTVNNLHRVQTVISSAIGVVGLLKNAIDVGFAELTAPIAALFPAIPAATLGMPYLGIPHTHTHPPSLIPPAPPIPLPSIGTIMFGTNVRVLLNSMPAARAGDLGLAPTCGGLAPFFEINTGSSSVFIGGARAARMLDFCKVCTPAPGEAAPAAKFFSEFMQVAGFATATAGMAADIADEAVQDDAAMSAAKGLAAAMTAAQMANDAIRMAMAAMMGTDPGMPCTGNILMGQPTVMIGGFPMINIPNPVDILLGKLGRLKGSEEPEEPEEEGDEGAGGGC
jgi:uncharacterized Zn-binding protein involved in type VI secretion